MTNLAESQTRQRLSSLYTLPFILSQVGFLFLVRDVNYSSLLTSFDLAQAKAKFNSYRLSFFSKSDLKRLLVKKPNFLKLLMSFRDSDTLTEVDLFSTEVSSYGLRGVRNGPNLLATNYMDINFNKARYTSRYFKNTSYNDIEAGREVNLKRVKFKPGYQRL